MTQTETTVTQDRRPSESSASKLMASFDPEEKENHVNSSCAEMTKYPIKRLELCIRKFVKVLDIDLDRLFKHTTNIARLTNAEDWTGLHKEQVNASRTIQQIKANIKDIERARNQCKDEDLSQFDEKVQEVKGKALAAMEEFMNFAGMQAAACHQPTETDEHTRQTVTGRGDFNATAESTLPGGGARESPPKLRTSGFQNLDNQPVIFDAVDSDGQSATPYGSLPATLTTMPAPFLTTSLHVVPQNSDASASWEQLQEDIVQLNGMVHEFAEHVQVQGEAVDRIDENIETAQQNVQEGTSHLAKAAKYKSVLLPVVGAVVGGAIGGPIGLAAGAKLGGLAGAMGGAVGFASGRFFKKRQDKISEVEMSNLSDQRSVSLPDLPSDEKRVNQSVTMDNHDRRGGEENAAKSQEEARPEGEEEEDVFASVTSSFKRFFSFSEEKEN